MMYVKQGYPEEDELVLCKVIKVLPNSIFCNLEEYNKQGMIHISEVSAGRIRNIRDYVVEGKVIVCKVLRVDKEKGHIDLSLRRVNEMQRKRKISEIKLEQKSMKIIEFMAKELKLDFKKVCDEIIPLILKDYNNIHSCFMDVVNENLDLQGLGINKRYVDVLTKLIKERIKPPEVIIKELVKISIYDPKGVDKIKKVLGNIEEAYKNVGINYAGAGKYRVILKGLNYKDLEKELEEINEKIKNEINSAEFERLESKKE